MDAARRPQRIVGPAMAAAVLTVASAAPAVAQDESRCPVIAWADRTIDGGTSYVADRWHTATGHAADLTPAPGLRFITPPRARLVVLVHGLDDTGRTFDTIIATLQAATDPSGEPVAVAVYDYPNDQAIADSARSLSIELESLRSMGFERTDVVAHSMGGLVTLDALNRFKASPVDHVITIGTPYAGAPLARIRALGEVRERWVRWQRSEDIPWTCLLGSLDDGDGEAGDDLLPGSEYFLSRADRATLPDSVTVVVGRAMGSAPERPAKPPRWWTPSGWWWAGRQLWSFATAALGDGAVPDASARAVRAQDVVEVRDWHGRLAHHPDTQSLVVDRLGLKAPGETNPRLSLDRSYTER